MERILRHLRRVTAVLFALPELIYVFDKVAPFTAGLAGLRRTNQARLTYAYSVALLTPSIPAAPFVFKYRFITIIRLLLSLTADR
jgi:hypothetical protein